MYLTSEEKIQMLEQEIESLKSDGRDLLRYTKEVKRKLLFSYYIGGSLASIFLSTLVLFLLNHYSTSFLHCC